MAINNIKRIFLVIFLAFVFLVLLEALSYVAYSRFRPVDNVFQGLEVKGLFDPRVIYALHPYYGFSRDPAGCLRGECNRFGFNGAELPSRHAPDTVFIGIFGGSVAGKLCTYNQDDLTKRFQTYPFFQNKRIEYACIALGGFKQPQQLMTLSYFLSLGLKFDLIINVDGFNEVALPLTENIPATVELSYPRMWNMYLRQNLNLLALKQIKTIEALRLKRKSLQQAFSRGPLSRSYFVKMILLALDRVEYRKHFELYRNLLNRGENEGLREYQAYGPKSEDHDLNASVERSVSLWRESSLQMAHLCRANNIAYFHFLQPNQYFSGTKQLTPQELKIAYSADNPYKKGVEQGYPLLVREGKALQEAGVRFFDLTNIFINEKNDIYGDDCCHLTAEGNKLLAEAITNAIGPNLNLGSNVD